MGGFRNTISCMCNQIENLAQSKQFSWSLEFHNTADLAHSQGNDLLREVFQLGPPPVDTKESKASRLERVGNKL